MTLSMETPDIVMTVAVLVGPLVAVQMTRYLDDRKEKRSRKLDIFKALMATRAYDVSMEHVSALNRIDLEFDKRIPKENAVVNAWKVYLDHLGQSQIPPEHWTSKRIDLFVDLMHTMAVALGYDFDKVHIKNATYIPRAHGELENEIQNLRKKTLDVLDGKRSIPFHVVNVNDEQENIR